MNLIGVFLTVFDAATSTHGEGFVCPDKFRVRVGWGSVPGAVTIQSCGRMLDTRGVVRRAMKHCNTREGYDAR